jgi:hypothetical protein
VASVVSLDKWTTRFVSTKPQYQQSDAKRLEKEKPLQEMTWWEYKNSKTLETKPHSDNYFPADRQRKSEAAGVLGDRKKENALTDAARVGEGIVIFTKPCTLPH